MKKSLFPHALFIFVISLFFIFNQSIDAQSPLDGFDPNANGTVRAVTVQPDGKLLIGGDFTTLAPNDGAPVTRNRFARLNADGTLDAAFNTSFNGSVYSITVQPDGKILVGGTFSSVTPNGGAPFSCGDIVRLNANGTVDTIFNPRADGFVYTIVVQPDGRILIGGYFATLSPNGGAQVVRFRVARLNPDGTVDAAFAPNPNNSVQAIALQSDGKIIIAGYFNLLAPEGGGTIAVNKIIRLSADGSLDTSFDPNPNNGVRAMAVQLDGKILIAGNFTTLAPNGGAPVARNCFARLNADGTVDAAFDPNVSGGSLVVYSIGLQPDGKILIGGEFSRLAPNGGATVTRFNIARVNADGTVDAIFDPNVNHIVNAIAVQSDGKILIVGYFRSLAPNGGTSVARNRIARLERDGRADQTLNPLINGWTVYCTAVQPDGKIIIGGDFFTVLGTSRPYIARLNTDGSLDTIFYPNPLGRVYAVAVQPDGKILIAGWFNTLSPNGGAPVPRRNIARVNADGSLDASFDPNSDGNIYAIALQPDGKIIIGGGFDSLAPNGGAAVARNNIARLNADGTLDTTFDPNANALVGSIAVQPDGKLLIGGDFTTLAPNGGAPVFRRYLARLNADGTLIPAFNPNPGGNVNSIAVQPDGRILIAGWFNWLAPNGGASVTRNYIARLNADGTLDMTFNPNANYVVWSIIPQSDGKVLVGGEFNTLAPNGGAQIPRNRFARLSNDTPALSALTVTRNAVTLTRDGSAPVFTRVVFEQSVNNGANWTTLGSAANGFASSSLPTGTKETGKNRFAELAPQAGSYILSGLNLPTGQNILIRARGFYRTGGDGGSESIEDKVQIAFLPAPTAAQVSVSGRVLSADGSGLKSASVMLTDASGNSRTVFTSSFGYFRFDSVQAGETYVFSVVAKGYQFAPQVVTVNEELSELNFTALE
ncbi:MAG TPA: carboxypeptidase regulatory-like domain-containing protein [Pyrinomonadaceae bacterium]|jgi:uncharacterized delta-60 repeat protein